MRIHAAVVALGLFGCSAAGEDAPPTLEITSPARGTLAEAGQVTVTGLVHDDGAVTVTVNGTTVTPAKDGTFTTTLTLDPGVGIVETHATDASGHDVRDVRAVLAGTLAPSDGSVTAPIGAHVGVEALRTIGNAIGTTAEAIDFTAAVQPMNPVYNNTGCLGAKIDITSIALSNIDVALVPKANAVDTSVAISNVVVRLHADYKAACIGGSTTITVRVAQARIHGDLGVAVTSGKIATSLAGTTVALDGFQLDVSGVPGAVESLFNSKVRDAVANSLTDIIKSKVPPMANAQLTGLLAKPYTVAVLGHDTHVTVAPGKVALSPTGLFVSVDTQLKVDGGEGGMFVSSQMPLTVSVVEQARGLGVAISSDVVNQLFSGLWAADAFDVQLPIDQVGVLAALLDGDARSLDVKISLPPTVTTEGGQLQLSIGDLIVTVRDAAGAEIQTLALSLRTTLAAEPSQSGKLLLTVGTPEIHAQVLAQSATVQRPLTDEQVEGIVGGVWGVVGSTAGDALASLPMPTVANVTLGAPVVEARDGFVVADIPLQ
jgi:hypothetical protein